MKRTDWSIGIVAGLILGILAGVLGISQKGIPVYASDETVQVRELMLRSHTVWDSLAGQATTIWHTKEHTETWHTTFRIQQPNYGYLEWTITPSDKAFQWFASDDGFYLLDSRQKVYTHLPVRDAYAFDMELKALPLSVKTIETDMVYRHPFGAQIPSLLGDYLYPTSMAQGTGEYTLLGKETLLNRPVYLLQYRNVAPDGRLATKSQYWVDAKTGIILKAVDFGGEDMQTIVQETTITALVLNENLNAETFRYRPAAPDFKLLSPDIYFSQQH